jgi:hypothetical protein
MLLGCPWLHNVKLTCDWVNNMITIEGNGIVWTITITKHLNNDTNDQNYSFTTTKITNEHEDVLLEVELDLFAIGSITLLKL